MFFSLPLSKLLAFPGFRLYLSYCQCLFTQKTSKLFLSETCSEYGDLSSIVSSTELVSCSVTPISAVELFHTSEKSLPILTVLLLFLMVYVKCIFLSVENYVIKFLI